MKSGERKTLNQSDQNEFINSIQSSFKNTSYNFDTLKINVDISSWIDTHKILKKDFNLSFFNWLSAVDWDNEVKTGDAPKEPVTPSFEILSCLSQTNSNNLVISSTVISKENAEIESLVDVFAGANWHEREAYEMFGINFLNHPNLTKLYLPDDYEGNPLLKSFELISREVKPWPGDVDVEGMPEDSIVVEEKGS
ncbi:MAG: NADH-quinone oxidoreductase subunit C [Candidatus Actinomarina sp.]|jgi:NADH-quinone oxidoreductase subunit C|tara:strand:- start:1738 stop:2322 length:585 start_codon:yes stop_codon:yes gene_type:complete